MAAPAKDTSYILGLVLDFETGGLKCQENAITQLAIHAHRLDTFERLGTYVMFAAPYNRRDVKGVASKRRVLKSKFDKPEEIPMVYADQAMSVTGITMEMLEQHGVSVEEMAEGVIRFISAHMASKTPKNKMPVFIAHNALFDEGFWCQLFEYAGKMNEMKKVVRGKEDFYGNWHPCIIDTLLLGQLAFAHNPSVTHYKLETLAELLGIELNDAHEADADVMATANILMILTKRMRRSGDGDEENDEEGFQLSKAKKSRPHFKI